MLVLFVADVIIWSRSNQHRVVVIGDPTSITPALKYSESAAVRSQDVPFLLGALSANPKVCVAP